MQEAMDEVGMIVEGVYSAKAAIRLAQKYQVELPIIEQVNKILFEDKKAADALNDLMLRDPKTESDAGSKRKTLTKSSPGCIVLFISKHFIR